MTRSLLISLIIFGYFPLIAQSTKKPAGKNETPGNVSTTVDYSKVLQHLEDAKIEIERLAKLPAPLPISGDNKVWSDSCKNLLDTIKQHKSDFEDTKQTARENKTKFDKCSQDLITITGQRDVAVTLNTQMVADERTSLEGDIVALSDQHYTFSSKIIENIGNRIKTLKGRKDGSISSQAEIQFNNFKNSCETMKTANALLSQPYSQTANQSSLNAFARLNLSGYSGLSADKEKLTELLKNYCSLTLEVKKLLNDTHGMSENLRQDAISRQQSVWLSENELEAYLYLVGVINDNVASKNANPMQSFTCQ